MTDRKAAPSAGAMYVLMFFSGAAGLGYEMVWTRTFSTGLGHEVVSMLSVVGAFFAGLALGSIVLDGAVSRSASPHRWYALLEGSIGVWALVTAVAIPAANGLVGKLTGPCPSPWRHWLVAFSLPLVLLLPATFAMGGTLPAMDRLVERLSSRKGRFPGLYSANTLGATTGVLATTYFLVPAIGYQRCLLVLAGISLVCGGFAWCARTAGAPLPGQCEKTGSGRNRLRHGITLFLTGLLGIGYEVLALRALEQVLEDTVYTFASMLSVYLLGTALGAAVYRHWLSQQDGEKLLSRLLQFVSAACAVGAMALWRGREIYLGLRALFPAGWIGSIVAEMLLASVVFLPATLAMGALFSHLAQGSRHDRGGVGWALGINTVGAALAPVLFGIGLLPTAGIRISLMCVIAGYLLLIPWRQLDLPVLAPAGLLVLISLGPGAESLVRVPAGMVILERREGVMATVTVTGDSSGQRMLSVNNFGTGGSGSRFPDYRQTHIPMLLHPAPLRVLSLGLGAGMTFEAAGQHPGVQADGVELVPEILPLLHYFRDPSARGQDGGDLHYYSADARRFVRAGTKPYDVIVGDLFHPARDGAGALYTLEHFQAVRRRLNENGIFCQWLPLYQLDLATVRLISRTFLQVFPNSSLWLCHNSVDSPKIGRASCRERVFGFV
jgi:spermidine synthase